MNTRILAASVAGAVSAAALLLSGCSSEPKVVAVNPPEAKVVTVPAPIVAVAPPASAMASTAPTFETKIGVMPPQGHDIRLQSFAGDVCVSDNRGGGFISHCICAGVNCTCQGAQGNCKP